jgi:hypothetical protein
LLHEKKFKAFLKSICATSFVYDFKSKGNKNKSRKWDYIRVNTFFTAKEIINAEKG